MAQIIKHRRGSITDVKGTTTRNGELLIASGSISDLSGPFVFIGSPASSDEGVAGAFKPTSKIYSGTSAPAISATTYGSILDGVPFYASGNESLYILNNDGVGNTRLDLTGNIEGNAISNVTITSLTGTTAYIRNVSGSFTGSGIGLYDIPASGITGLELDKISSGIATASISSTDGLRVNTKAEVTGSMIVTGDQTIGGNLAVTGTTIFGGSSEFLNDVNVTGNFDINSNFIVDAATGDVTAGNITGSNLQLSGNAKIDGNITLGGNITVGDANTDFVTFGAEISSSIIPDVHNAFDLGSADKNWKDLHVSGTAFIDTLQAVQVNFSDLGVLNDLSVSGDTYLEGNILVTGSATFDGDVIIGDASNDTLTINASTIDLVNIQAGTDNSVVVYNGSSLVTDEIDSRVWGNTLLDNNGTSLTANRVPFVLDGDSLQDDAEFTYNSTTNVLTIDDSTFGTDVLIGDVLTVSGATELMGAVGINSTLDVTGSATFKNNLNVEGNVSITGTTSISGATTIDDILTVTGDSDLQGDADVHGELTVTGNTNLQGNLYVSGNLQVLGSATNVTIQSTTVEIDDNIIRLNAFSPFERYAGFEVMDSGSTGVSASLVWDSTNDYWMFVSSSAESSKLVGTTAGTYGSEVSLTTNTIPKATGTSTIGDSLLADDTTILTYNTNKFTVSSTDGATLIAGNVTLSAAGGADAGNNTSTIVFKNSSNVLGYVSTTETTDVLDGILGYKTSDGALVFSTVIDGGTY